MRPFAPYDTRHYETADVRSGYEVWSETYDAKMTDRIDRPLLEAMRFDWRGTVVLDQACGTGRIGAWLRQKGASAIDGLDMTEAMLDKARGKGIYRTLLLADVRSTGLPDASYDAVVQVLACEHLDAIEPLYAEVKRITKPKGVFVLVGYHPYMMLRGIPTHFTRSDGRDLAIQQFIHLTSDHVNAGTAAGLRLEQMEENVVDEAWVADNPKYQRHFGSPISFALRFSA